MALKATKVSYFLVSGQWLCVVDGHTVCVVLHCTDEDGITTNDRQVDSDEAIDLVEGAGKYCAVMLVDMLFAATAML